MQFGKEKPIEVFVERGVTQSKGRERVGVAGG